MCPTLHEDPVTLTTLGGGPGCIWPRTCVRGHSGGLLSVLTTCDEQQKAPTKNKTKWITFHYSLHLLVWDSFNRFHQWIKNCSNDLTYGNLTISFATIPVAPPTFQVHAVVLTTHLSSSEQRTAKGTWWLGRHTLLLVYPFESVAISFFLNQPFTSEFMLVMTVSKKCKSHTNSQI